MNKRSALGIALAGLVLIMVASTCEVRLAKAQPRSWTVDDDAPADFSTIQEAVIAANPGDTILVRNGTYSEHVVVDRALTLLGQDRSFTIIDGALNGTAIELTTNNIRISAFTIRSGYRGIHIKSDQNTISNNNITLNTYEGLLVEDSVGNTITNNLIHSNGEDGIYMINTRNNTLQRNSIAFNNWTGIFVETAHGEIITNNTVDHNEKFGVRCDDCRRISITGNTISRNTLAGINLFNTTDSDFHHNNFIDNTEQIDSFLSLNAWDNGVEGNFWSNYNGTDFYSGSDQNESRSDGIGDDPYLVDEANQDNYPLMRPARLYDAGTWDNEAYTISVTSNSTVSQFNLSKADKRLSFMVDGAATAVGFSRVTIPNTIVQDLWSDGFRVSVDGEPPLRVNSWTFEEFQSIYVTYLHQGQRVVIQASDITPPTISQLSPENKTYASRDIPLTFAASEPVSWMGYTLNGQANTTVSGNTSLSGLAEGRHRITLYANDTSGNMGCSDPTHFTVDTTAPHIEILSPENRTYTANAILLSFDVDEATSWIGFSLDGQANQTLDGAMTIADLSEGSHNLIVYARDLAGNTGASHPIYFGVAAPFPLALIIASLGAIVAIFVALLLYRKKGKRTRKARKDLAP